jgi:hypothetical protein
MDTGHEDCYVVFVRSDRSAREPSDGTEHALALCSSYEEARRVQREYQGPHGNCIIRYVGTAGGGD